MLFICYSRSNQPSKPSAPVIGSRERLSWTGRWRKETLYPLENENTETGGFSLGSEATEKRERRRNAGRRVPSGNPAFFSLTVKGSGSSCSSRSRFSYLAFNLDASHI